MSISTKEEDTGSLPRALLQIGESMEFHIAGLANDANFADAEAVLDDLAMNLPDVTVRKHMRDKVTLRITKLVCCGTNVAMTGVGSPSGPHGSSNFAVAWASLKSSSQT